jgi:aquaporin Z
MSLAFAFSHISGAHFNPAVSLSFLVKDPRVFPPLRCLTFVVSQVLGGLVGALVAYAIAGSGHIQPFRPEADLADPVGSAFAAEFAYTFALCVVIHQVSVKNEEEPNSYFAMAVGFTVLGGAAAVGRVSGGVFNPAIGTAVDFAASVVGGMGTTQRLWIYWTAPPAAAVLAGLASRLVEWSLLQEDKEHAEWEQSARLATQNNEAPPENAAEQRLPLRAVLAELVGTFFVTLTAALGAPPLAVGAMYAAMVYAGDHICGADFNPAVSLGVLLRYGIFVDDWWKTFVVAVAQVVGGLGAGLLTWGVRGRASFPAEDGAHGTLGAFAFEVLWTGLIIFVVCTATTPTSATPARERTGHGRSYHGVAIGFAYAAGAYCSSKAGSGSGGVFNPAVGTGAGVAALLAREPEGRFLWIYWAAPLLGAVLGGALYSLLHARDDDAALSPPLATDADLLSSYGLADDQATDRSTALSQSRLPGSTQGIEIRRTTLD